ncbi:MAG: rhomboid family intramembrane serine protease [Pseudonocardia sp.]|nr:rhomboid family intramembrane serine protease [Pseudonocardia sp.]MBO0876022.1 rhomboid family intramembrane serine protease [Pseudonocardia sp.]
MDPTPPSPGGSHPDPPPDHPTCTRHPGRATGLRCVRCDRPFCPQCLRDASVGFQCVECLGLAGRGMSGGAGRERRAPTRSGQPLTIAGAAPTGRPLMVPGLIAVNVLIFILTVAEAGSVTGNAGSSLFSEWSLRPDSVANGEWWRLITAGFLHFGPLHLAFNMLALWVIGRDLELVLGRIRFLAVYLVGLLGGSAAALLFSGLDAETAGASGAVFGLMGGLAVVLRRLRHSPAPALTLIAVNIVISFVVPNISIAGHIGGLVAGGLATAAMVYAPGHYRNQWQAALTVALVVLLVLAMSLRATTMG